MKLKNLLPQLGLLAVLLAIQILPLATVRAQGTAFTYQGRLDDGGVPASGVYDLRFRLYDAETNGAQVGTAVFVSDLPVTNGLFTVALDFGSGPFSGNDRWLQIGLRPGASSAAYTILDPLQPLTPTPYAIYAAKADAAALTGTLLDARLSTNVARRTGGNVFSGGQTFTGAFQVTNNNGAFRFTGFSPNADGATLTASLEATSTNWPRLRFEREAGGTFMDVGQNASGDFHVRASGTERFTVRNNGNVGIDTTSPAYKLDVNGLVNVAGIRFPDGSILRSALGLPNVDPPIGSASFTAAGTYSWTAPSNAASIVVDIKGGGGGGGGGGAANDTVWLGPRTQSGVYTASVHPGGTGGGGGGEGNSQRFTYLVTPGTMYTIVVGAGGTAGAAGQNGGDGDASFFRLGATVITSAPGGGRGFGGITIPTNATFGEFFYPTGGLAGVAGVVAPGGIVTTNQGGRPAHRSNWFYLPENWNDDSPINTINSSFRWTSGPYQSEYNDVPQPAGDGGPGTGGAAGVGAARNAVYNHPPTAVADYYLNREATPGQAGLPGKVSFTIY